MRRISLLAVILFISAPLLAVDQYGYRVLERKPLGRENFVQGLEIVGNHLYLSSGLYGLSRLRRYDFDTGQLLLERPLDPRLFAEGVTVLGDKVYQLTWRSQLGLIYLRDTLTPLQLFQIPGEGWGLTNDGKQLIYSDGSAQLYFVDPDAMTLTRTLAVTENGSPLPFLNELEWIEGRVWANEWRSNRLVVINPETGAVEESISLHGLLSPEEYRADTDVLNGIAVDQRDGSIWVTGKRWPWLYRIERLLLDSDAATPAAESAPPLLAKPPGNHPTPIQSRPDSR